MLLPQSGGEQIDLRGRVLAHALQDVDQVVVRIDLMQPAGHDEALDDAHVLGPQFRPGEEPGLASHRNGSQRTLQVVGPDETDGTPDKVSMESPLGRALLGTKQGDDVEVELPRGDAVFNVVTVEQP